MSRREEVRVWCANCGERIVGCDGLLGDWKHEATNTERCAGASTMAIPEGPRKDILRPPEAARARC